MTDPSAAEIWYRYLEVRSIVGAEWANAWLGAQGIEPYGVSMLADMAERRDDLRRMLTEVGRA